MDLPVLRVADVERRAVVEQLGSHYADGRLTLDELRDRTAEAWAARTDADLAVALRQLPRAVPAPAASAPPLRWRVPSISVRAHALLAVAGVTAAWAIEDTGATPGDQWPLALAAAWAAVLAAHAAGARLQRAAELGE